MASTAPAFTMPAEWAPHERTWMAFPSANPTFDDPQGLDAARRAWAAVADTIARYEPVTLITAVGESALAREYLTSPQITLAERPLDDAWMRDIGPTFVTSARTGRLAAVDWVFNGWGAQSWATWEHDRHIAGEVAALAGAERIPSTLVNEGGGIHVDGEGTVLLTETVQLDQGRNPGLGKAEVEAEIHARLGTRKALWLPRGLTRDYDEYGTRGHVDIVASFLRHGVVAVHRQLDPAHPDFEPTREIAALLRASTDAHGCPLEVVEIPAPRTLTDPDGAPVDYSYINHYLCNGAVVLCAFDDPHDERAAEVFARAFPHRKVELVDAREIFANGGGIHCITQQQPAV
ncbi:agmatine deiminase family protein [Phaeacidiphilus oryzae]|jgi:agmatine deiminase|uniref:agmatine deiminase family protein n=1 Tax=Phaeacidiphilus oryzae TaxID=348818 RepID=UPI000ADBE282|nr:agmatine deiminase family protein [Phaeacidiphilus oryzae]